MLEIKIMHTFQSRNLTGVINHEEKIADFIDLMDLGSKDKKIIQKLKELYPLWLKQPTIFKWEE